MAARFVGRLFLQTFVNSWSFIISNFGFRSGIRLLTKSLVWSCEKMIHAYASIWRCLMHDIIIEIREKNMCARSSPWNKHTRVEMETIVSHYTENI